MATDQSTTPPEIAALSDGERQRLLDGRADWREDDWQDHCGDLDCSFCDGEIPSAGPNDLKPADQALRAALKESPDAE